jgi:hypothetical protein
MASQLVQDLRQALIAGQDKYTHFLLATAAAAIAFSVQRTSDVAAAWSQLPLATAVGLWGYSFWCGCRRLESIIHINAMTIDWGLEPTILGRPHTDEENARQQRRMMAAGEVAGRHWRHQFQSLIAGGGLFVAWHILEMFLRGGYP